MLKLQVLDKVDNLTETYQSPLLQGYFLVGDFKQVALVAMLYLYMCFIGPRLMASRKEFHVKPVMQVYNVFMVALNAWILYELICTSINRNWMCEKLSTEKNEYNMRHATAIWVYYLSKPVEFLDTFFFIVRKKFDQLSFLHVYHHSSMMMAMWLIVTFCPSGDAFFPVFCNATVHVIMYGYYFIAALGPEYQKYVWWKKHLTKFQIIQFFSIMGQAAASIYVSCNPTYNGYHWFILGYMVSFVVLFSHFYFMRYIRASRSKKQAGGKTPAKTD